MLEKKWLPKAIPENNIIDQLQLDLGIDRQLCSLLGQRDIITFQQAKKFFRPNSDHIYDPFLMKGMKEAMNRIESALGDGEKIMVYGDYDVDGTTSIAMVYSFLKKYSTDIEYYVPDRYNEGYGISFQSIDYAAEHKIGLVIALDCGIKAIDKIEYAKEKSIDFIICDHHLPGDQLPDAIILNPKQKGCGYPFKDLSGAGVGFKLLQAFCIKNDIKIEEANEYLDLLAISIGADMVPITDENRVFAQFGMQKLNDNPTLGIKAIVDKAGVKRELNMRDVGFLIGPQINAAGRIAHASKAVELLLAQTEDEAEFGSEGVGLDNSERKILDAETTKEALSILNSDDIHQNKSSTVIAHEKWNKGILGIVANKLQEFYYRPTIVLALNNGVYTGSARSVNGYHIYDAISSCSDLLESFGGHAFAAGLTLKPEHLNKFIEEFEAVVSMSIREDDLIPKIKYDLPLGINEVTPQFFKILNQLEPFGQDNDQPIFLCKGVKALPSVRVVGKDHLKMEIVDFENPSQRISAIAFKQVKHYDWISKGLPFDVLYSLELNEWKGNVSIQANIRDIKVNC